MTHWKTFIIITLGLILLAGCGTIDTEEVVAPTLYDRMNLSFETDGFVDSRSGWFFPQVLLDRWIADQAWEFDKAVIGIEYVRADELPDLSTLPLPLAQSTVKDGTVSIAAYPIGYSMKDEHPHSYLGPIPPLVGLGYQNSSAMEEFWAYQKTIEAKGYNLWKLVKLQLGDSPDRIFHSQLVLKKLSEEKSEGIVITVGPAADCFVVIVVRKHILNKDELDAFGDWAYDILRELNLKALKY